MDGWYQLIGTKSLLNDHQAGKQVVRYQGAESLLRHILYLSYLYE